MLKYIAIFGVASIGDCINYLICQYIYSNTSLLSTSTCHAMF